MEFIAWMGVIGAIWAYTEIEKLKKRIAELERTAPPPASAATVESGQQ